MTGLDQIIDQIRQDAEQIAARNKKQAEDEAEKILQQAREDAAQSVRLIEEKTESEKKERIARAQSAAQLEKRKRLLSAKQQIIAEMMEEAKNGLLELPEQDYFSLLVQMSKKYAQPQEGELRLSKRDLDRMPKSFEASVQNGLPKGAKLVLSDQTAAIDGGFLLVYGGIEENCSFEALFESDKERLQDAAQELLFANE